MRIFINPGHCVGVDSGAVGNGLVEAEVALNIGEMVGEYLEEAGYKTNVFQYDGLRTITGAANAWGADLFVSIHCNAAATAAANGAETFYWNGSAAGKKLANCIQNQLVHTLPLANRGIKTANFTVLAYTDMPAVLVETAFVSNAYDARILETCQEDFARAIARGVTDFYK